LLELVRYIHCNPVRAGLWKAGVRRQGSEKAGLDSRISIRRIDNPFHRKVNGRVSGRKFAVVGLADVGCGFAAEGVLASGKRASISVSS